MATDYQLTPIDPGGQLHLLPDDVTDEMLSKAEAQQGICTGDRLKHYDAPRYNLICTLLAEGSLSQRQISRISGVSRNLIAGIVKSQASDIEPLKARLAGQLSALHQLCVDRAIEMVLDDDAKVSLKDLMVGAGVSAEKMLLMAGEATQIHKVERVDPDEFNRRLGGLSDADRIRLESMGLPAGKSKTNRPVIDVEEDSIDD